GAAPPRWPLPHLRQHQRARPARVHRAGSGRAVAALGDRAQPARPVGAVRRRRPGMAVYNYNEVRLVELQPDLSGVVEGSERVIIPAGNGMGEGHHFYKVDGRYYIISANYAPVGRMQAARADSLDGP